jgi:hypothetical protein
MNRRGWEDSCAHAIDKRDLTTFCSLPTPRHATHPCVSTMSPEGSSDATVCLPLPTIPKYCDAPTAIRLA